MLNSKLKALFSGNKPLLGPGISRPISYRYLARLTGHISLVVLIVLLAVEAIFMSDIIISLILPQLLALDASVLTIATITLFATPRGIFIALPTAILIGVYLILLRRREDQELIISAGFGYDLKPLIAVGFLIGLGGAVFSLAVSGFVEPHARHHFRTTISSAADQAIRNGELTAGRFYSVEDVTLYAASGRLSDVAENVFIHQKEPENISRVISARRTQNPEVTKDGHIGLVFNDAHIYDFATPDFSGNPEPGKEFSTENCPDCDEAVPGSLPNYLFLSVIYFEFPPMALPQHQNRWGVHEATSWELLFNPEFDANGVRALAERSLRAVLCILAPFLAMVAVSMTTRATLLVAMPTAAGIVLLLSFFNSGMIQQLSHLGHAVTGLALLVILGLIVALCITLLYRLRGNLMRSIGITL